MMLHSRGQALRSVVCVCVFVYMPSALTLVFVLVPLTVDEAEQKINVHNISRKKKEAPIYGCLTPSIGQK